MRRLVVMQSVAELLRVNPKTAYYDATRSAARAKFARDSEGFRHWSRVAAEISRSTDCPMDVEEVRRIVDEEARRG